MRTHKRNARACFLLRFVGRFCVTRLVRTDKKLAATLSIRECACCINYNPRQPHSFPLYGNISARCWWLCAHAHTLICWVIIQVCGSQDPAWRMATFVQNNQYSVCARISARQMQRHVYAHIFEMSPCWSHNFAFVLDAHMLDRRCTITRVHRRTRPSNATMPSRVVVAAMCVFLCVCVCSRAIHISVFLIKPHDHKSANSQLENLLNFNTFAAIVHQKWPNGPNVHAMRRALAVAPENAHYALGCVWFVHVCFGGAMRWRCIRQPPHFRLTPRPHRACRGTRTGGSKLISLY